MGFNAWRNLSVLLLAGAALIGCNNTPQKNKESIGLKGPQQGGPAGGIGQANKGGFPPGTPVGTNGQPFPTNPNPSPFLPTSGPGQPGLNPSNPQQIIGGDPGRFAPMPGGSGSNFSAPNNPFAPAPNPINQAPSMPKSTFGIDGRDSRISQPALTNPPGTGALDPPQGFKQQ